MIYIVIRKTLDWNDEAAFRAQLPERVRDGVAAWNAAFDMPYHVYRRELKGIAAHNLARVEAAQCVPAEEIPPGALAVPVDDDDWFAPHLARVLEQHHGDGLAGYYWPGRFLELPISRRHHVRLLWRRLNPSAAPVWLCSTNNYAVVFGSETADLLTGHVRATHWFLAHPSAVRRLDQPLSLMNRTLASTTQLWSRPSVPLLRRKYRRYSKLYERPAPADLPWCAPYIAMMRDLHAALHPRRS